MSWREPKTWRKKNIRKNNNNKYCQNRKPGRNRILVRNTNAQQIALNKIITQNNFRKFSIPKYVSLLHVTSSVIKYTKKMET